MPADVRRPMAAAVQAPAPAAPVAAHDVARSAKEDEPRRIPVTRAIPVIAAITIRASRLVGLVTRRRPAFGIDLATVIPLRVARVGLLAPDGLPRRGRCFTPLLDRPFLDPAIRRGGPFLLDGASRSGAWRRTGLARRTLFAAATLLRRSLRSRTTALVAAATLRAAATLFAAAGAGAFAAAAILTRAILSAL